MILNYELLNKLAFGIEYLEEKGEKYFFSRFSDQERKRNIEMIQLKNANLCLIGWHFQISVNESGLYIGSVWRI